MGNNLRNNHFIESIVKLLEVRHLLIRDLEQGIFIVHLPWIVIGIGPAVSEVLVYFYQVINLRVLSVPKIRILFDQLISQAPGDACFLLIEWGLEIFIRNIMRKRLRSIIFVQEHPSFWVDRILIQSIFFSYRMQNLMRDANQHWNWWLQYSLHSRWQVRS